MHSKDRKNWKITLSFGFYNQKTPKIGTIYIVWFLCIVNPLSIVYHSKANQQLVLELYFSSIVLALSKMKVQDISISLNKISHKMLFKDNLWKFSCTKDSYFVRNYNVDLVLKSQIYVIENALICATLHLWHHYMTKTNNLILLWHFCHNLCISCRIDLLCFLRFVNFNQSSSSSPWIHYIILSPWQIEYH